MAATKDWSWWWWPTATKSISFEDLMVILFPISATFSFGFPQSLPLSALLSTLSTVSGNPGGSANPQFFRPTESIGPVPEG